MTEKHLSVSSSILRLISARRDFKMNCESIANLLAAFHPLLAQAFMLKVLPQVGQTILLMSHNLRTFYSFALQTVSSRSLSGVLKRERGIFLGDLKNF